MLSRPEGTCPADQTSRFCFNAPLAGWYVPRADIEEAALIPVQGQTFCPYKGPPTRKPDDEAAN
jgi:uncharacterized protein (DUF427 family)